MISSFELEILHDVTEFWLLSLDFDFEILSLGFEILQVYIEVFTLDIDYDLKILVLISSS